MTKASLKRSTLVYNPAAGTRQNRRQDQIRRVSEQLSKNGLEVNVQQTTGPGSAHFLASQAVAAGTDLIVVYGGDGTINDVANALAEGPVPLGVLPGGTANIAAKELGLPEDPVEAAARIAEWTSKPIALGRATWTREGRQQQRFFLSVAGVGFDAHVIRQLSLAAKAEYGVAAYVLEALRQFFIYRYPSFACSADGVVADATLAVAQRSRRYAGWLQVAPGANFLTSKLASCMFLGKGFGSYVAYGFAVLLGQHMHLPDVHLAASDRMVCKPKEPGSVIDFELDGELVGQLPAVFDVVPDALTLVAPWPEKES